MALIKAREVVDAIMAHLDAGSTTNYLSQGPKRPSGKYCVVHPFTPEDDGSLGDPAQNSIVQFQTTSVGETSEQALWVQDTVAARLHLAVLTVATGVTTHPIRAVKGSAQPVLRDDDIEPPMFYATKRWRVHAIPE